MPTRNLSARRDRTLHWVPLWERDAHQIPEQSAVVYLDAGMAFGTGAHETTRLCARRLLDFIDANPDSLADVRLIDAGCSSGVSLPSCIGLGFEQNYAFDFDPEAIRVCQGASTTTRRLGQPSNLPSPTSS